MHNATPPAVSQKKLLNWQKNNLHLEIQNNRHTFVVLIGNVGIATRTQTMRGNNICYRSSYMKRPEIIENIQEVLHHVLPRDAKIILFGSEARGEAREDSDIDLLILLNKDSITYQDRQMVGHPLYDIELKTNTIITPIIRTQSQWTTQVLSPFKYNIEKEGIIL